MLRSHADFVSALRRVYGAERPPKPLDLLLAAERVKAGEDARAVAREFQTTRQRLERLVNSSDPTEALFGGPIPPLDPETESKVRRNLGQLLLAQLAERTFEDIYKTSLGTSDLRLEDDRATRSDTDYRVLNGQDRPVFRINIKFHGSPFQRARDLVNLDPEDCFALATYKIHHALEKQNQEHLAFIFLIVGVPALTGAAVGTNLPEDLVHLSAAVHDTSITQKRAVEDAVVTALTNNPEEAGFAVHLREYDRRIRGAPWYALSARKAFRLLTEKLFERAYALRVRAFARNYRNAELDMHFSLAEDLTPLREFLRVLRDDGLHGLVLRLERGTM